MQAVKVGGMPIRLLKDNGYAGAIYPVHRDAMEIQGLRAYASLAAIGRPVDLAIVAVPASGCEETMAQMVRTGTRAAVMFTSGFAEIGGEGAALQRRLADQAQRAGILLLGPNCLGAMNLHARVFATFSPVVLGGAPTAGRVALVSQSGAFGGYAFSLAREAQLGLGYWITTGNEAGVQVADAIDWLAREDSCDVMLVYLEGARDIPRLRAALLAARAAGKPVVVVKVGSSEAGARAARLHTGSDTGDACAYAELLDTCGVHRAASIGELFRMGYTLTRGRRLAGVEAVLPVAIFSISGGIGIMMADRAEELGFALPPLPEEAAQRLKLAIPFASTVNPIDVTGQVFAQPGVLVTALHDAATCGRYRCVVAFLAAAGKAPGVWPALQAGVAALREMPEAVPLVFSGIFDAKQKAWLEDHGCLVFTEPADTVEAIRTLQRQGAGA